jgi:hypothetical protein
MTSSPEPPCRIVATLEPDSRLWSFHLVNDGEAAIESAELKAVRYEWGDQDLGGALPGTRVADLAPGARALVWQDDGSSEMRTDLWLLVTLRGHETWLLFEFPRLYRLQATTLVAQAARVGGPPSDIA